MPNRSLTSGRPFSRRNKIAWISFLERVLAATSCERRANRRRKRHIECGLGQIACRQALAWRLTVVSTEDKKALKARAKELTDGDWAAKAVKDAIDEAAAATGAAVGAAAVAGGG